jgi:hypothetical protein
VRARSSDDAPNSIASAAPLPIGRSTSAITRATTSAKWSRVMTKAPVGSIDRLGRGAGAHM